MVVAVQAIARYDMFDGIRLVKLRKFSARALAREKSVSLHTIL